MPSEPEFLQAIHDEPDNDDLRLVFADWLEEHGDSRGELIRVQVALSCRSKGASGRSDLERQERELLTRYGAAWLKPLGSHVRRWRFCRGLLRLEVWAEEFLRDLGETPPRECAWVEQIKLLGARRETVRELGGLTPLVSLRVLDLGEGYLGDKAIEALAAEPVLARLTELNLARNVIGAGGATALAYSPHLAGLSVLHLGSNGLDSAGVSSLAGSRCLAGLTTLSLAANWIRAADVAALAHSRAFPELRTLILSDNNVGDGGACALAESRCRTRLATLDLSRSNIGDRGALALAGAAHLTDLKAVRLFGNRISEAAAEVLRRRFGEGTC